MTSIGNYQMQVPPGVDKRWLWRLALHLERLGAEKPAAKLYRKALTPMFRHNHHCGPDFNLKIRGGRFEVSWRGRQVLEGALPARPEVYPQRPCLILGSGPSINGLDERVFTECDILAVNGSILKCVELGQRACAYIVQDPNFIETSFDIFKKGLDHAGSLYLSAHVIAAITRLNATLLSGREVYLLERANRAFSEPRREPGDYRKLFGNEGWLQLSDQDKADVVGWSYEPAKGVFTGSTVIYSALQLGVFLGYKSIALAGVDFTAGAAGSRFYTERGVAAISHLDYNFAKQILPSFVLASKILAAEKVLITNFSIQSRLPNDVIPKSSSVDFYLSTGCHE